MMKKIIKHTLYFFIAIIVIISCEPISVSVNSNGDVAFTRNEGVFYININSGKVDTLDWNYGSPTIPIIVRWSPDGKTAALTVKDNKDSQNTSVYLIDKSGNKRKLYSISKIITQMEWSTDGKYLTIAQAGEDTNINVADIVLISAADAMSKTIVENCGDVHKWLNENSIVFMKINKKNENNGDIFLGELSIYKTEFHNSQSLIKVFIPRTGGIDCSPASGQIAFTAIDTTDENGDFAENMTADAYLYLYDIKEKKLNKWTDDVINFTEYSPDGNNILVKVKDKENYSAINLGYIDMKDNLLKLLVKNITDTVSASSTSVQAYPAWLDNQSVLYWRSSNNYGSSGEYLQLMSINISSLKKKNHQVTIDTEIQKLVEANGGY